MLQRDPNTINIASYELRRNMGQILQEVAITGMRLIVEKNNRPVVAVVPLKDLEHLRREREEFFDLIRKVQSRNEDADPDEVMELVLEAQHEMRKELLNNEL